jgi:two-component system cell cycle response regulator
MDKSSLCLSAIKATRDGLVITEYREGKSLISYVNPAFEELTGYPIDECLGRNCNFLQREDREQPEIEQIREAIKLGQSVLVTLRNYKKDGTLFWNELSISPIKNEFDEITHFVGIQKDVTKRVNLEEQIKFTNLKLEEANKNLQHNNKIDHLTGLYNRRAMDEELSDFINIARREKSTLAFYSIDIDNFKLVNDEYGHEVGDTCIKYVAAQLLNVFKRAQDLVLRYGGEEFLVVSYGGCNQQFDCLADMALKNISGKEVSIPELNLKLRLTESIGVYSVTVTNDFKLKKAIQNADSAMYQAKQEGKNQVAYFSQ